jgi:GNAT superfamily N-acetyltransferase
MIILFAGLGSYREEPEHHRGASGMLTIVQAERPEDLEAARYLILAHAASLREHPGSDQVRADAESLPGPYAPPRGRLYLARLDGMPAGCVALRPLEETVAEVKRMFVISTARRVGVARALMEQLLTDASRLHYHTIRLGTLQEMTAAQALYRRLGFVQIPRYRPDEMIDTVFFELRLSP